jgi:hypothetical protein
VILFLSLFLFFAAPAPSSLEQVKADPNPDHRARAAIDYASVAEKNAEVAYDKGEMKTVAAELRNVQESLEAAQEAFEAAHRTPGRNPGPFKYAEMHTRELLIRLTDLEQKMDASERPAIADVKARVQEIHDAWFEGIMGRKK